MYRATRPFHAERLSQLLFQWPIPVKDTLLEAFADVVDTEQQDDGDSSQRSPFCGIVRSKGFAWIAPSTWSHDDNHLLDDSWRHNAVVYWSHAGKHLDLQQNAGTWWAEVPDAQRRQFLDDYERVMREDFVTEEFGDRRQELVFIGVDVQQEAIERALDGCLLTEAEMEVYREKVAAMRSSAATVGAS